MSILKKSDMFELQSQVTMRINKGISIDEFYNTLIEIKLNNWNDLFINITQNKWSRSLWNTYLVDRYF